MMPHIEWLVLIGYLESLFAESSSRKLEPPPAGPSPETLNRLYLNCMREHERKTALFSLREGRWEPLPDWRLDRRVIRLALYLQERIGLSAGDRVAVVSELRPEAAVADFAALGLGAVSVVVDADVPANNLVAALIDVGPKVIFASPAGLDRLDGGTLRLPGLEQVIALDGGELGEGVVRLEAALELGGTLDTAERAQAFRANARGVEPGRAAIVHYEGSENREPRWQELSQGEAVQRVEAIWGTQQPSAGDRVYLIAPEFSLAVRLALYASLGDGYSSAALASSLGTAAELTELRPHRVIASPGIIAQLVRRARAAAPPPARPGGWRARAALLFRQRKEPMMQQAMRDVLGSQVRGISPTEPLDPALAANLQGVTLIGPPVGRTAHVWTGSERGGV
ncbi:MAG TPA: AMP-binding protein [Gemmatimonadales bacterium]|jgi:long-chain acyl-CoA synthetase